MKNVFIISFFVFCFCINSFGQTYYFGCLTGEQIKETVVSATGIDNTCFPIENFKVGIENYFQKVTDVNANVRSRSRGISFTKIAGAKSSQIFSQRLVDGDELTDFYIKGYKSYGEGPELFIEYTFKKSYISSIQHSYVTDASELGEDVRIEVSAMKIKYIPFNITGTAATAVEMEWSFLYNEESLNVN